MKKIILGAILAASFATQASADSESNWTVEELKTVQSQVNKCLDEATKDMHKDTKITEKQKKEFKICMKVALKKHFKYDDTDTDN